MNLMEDFMKCVNYRVSEGSDFQWSCWGAHVYRLDSWNGDHDGHTISIVFDTRDHVTYCLEAFDYARNCAYRWFSPTYRGVYFAEAKTRGVDSNEAWEDVVFVDLETLEDFWEKARAIVAGEDYDTRVQVPINLPDESLFQMMMLAHERDITLNQLVEEVLREAIERHEHQPA
jgi:hypothetical protein